MKKFLFTALLFFILFYQVFGQQQFKIAIIGNKNNDIMNFSDLLMVELVK